MAYLPEKQESIHGYHLKKITKGVFGEFSKIKEEVQELEDALNQQSSIMAIMELSDLYGAMRGLLKTKFPSITMKDLEVMSDITERAFINGFRD